MDLIVVLSGGIKSIKGQHARERGWKGLQTIGKTGFIFSGSCIFVDYSFISLTSKGDTSAQCRNIEYVNLQQVCNAASHLARLVACSCFEFPVRVFKSLSLLDFIGSFPLILNPAAALQIREISSPLVLSLKKVIFLFIYIANCIIKVSTSTTWWQQDQGASSMSCITLSHAWLGIQWQCCWAQ